MRSTSREINRRRFLQLSAAAALGSEIAKAESLDSFGESAHAEIWRRFIDPRCDVLLHYAGLKGEVVWPTPEDCAASRPSAMSWSTPIEDGPFFGGLYLDALCNRWRARQDDESADKARKIAAGLLELSTAADTPGFIARGFASDGRSHYAASSEDQMFPWFYGLWRYLQSGLAKPDEARLVRERLIDVVQAIEAHGWRVPCHPASFGFRGDLTRPDCHDAARLLCLHRAMHALTGDDAWLQKYRTRIDERIGKQNRTRREICAAGLDFGPADKKDSFIWTQSMSQAALRALAEMESEPTDRAAFITGLTASAHSARPHLARGLKFDRENNLHFEIDWRFLNTAWRPQRNCDESIALARELLAHWAERSPRSPYEDDTVREPLFAAWVIALADPAQRTSEIAEMLARYDWTRLYSSTFFIAVNLAYESQRPRLKD